MKGENQHGKNPLLLPSEIDGADFVYYCLSGTGLAAFRRII